MKETPKHRYRTLFFSILYLSAFTFGGGYVIIPLMKQKFVDRLGWITEAEMLDYTAIAQSAPGAVAVDASILVGYRVAGIPGACLSVVATVLPPLVILSVVSLFYTAFRDNAVVSAVLRGMQAGVAAVIWDVTISMGGEVARSRSALSILLMAAVFAATYFLGLNAAWSILACGALGAARSVFRRRKKGGVAP